MLIGFFELATEEAAAEVLAEFKKRFAAIRDEYDKATAGILAKPHLYQCWDRSCLSYKWQPIFSEYLGCAECSARGKETRMRYLGYLEDECLPEQKGAGA